MKPLFLTSACLVLLWPSAANAQYYYRDYAPWMSRRDVAESTSIFMDRLNRFHSYAVDHTDRTQTSPLVRQSKQLWRDAEYFHDVVEYGASYDVSLTEFRRLDQGFRELHRIYTSNPEAQQDVDVREHWERVIRAWDRIPTAMGFAR
jgi:hypothetical protein